MFSCYFWTAPSPFSYGIWQHTTIQLMRFLLSQEPQVSSWLKWFKDTFLKTRALNIHLKCISVRKKKKKSMDNTTEMKQMLHNTLSNLTKFLKFYWRKNLFLPGKDKTYFANFLWISRLRYLAKWLCQEGRDEADSSQLGAQFLMLCFIWVIFLLWFYFFVLFCFFSPACYSSEVSPHLCVSITYRHSCLILYSPSGLRVPDKLWWILPECIYIQGNWGKGN